MGTHSSLEHPPNVPFFAAPKAKKVQIQNEGVPAAAASAATVGALEKVSIVVKI